MRPKAIAFATYGGPEVLQITNTDIPEPDPDQVRVAVRAAGVNPYDWKVRSGAMAAAVPLELPYVPGLELAGTVDAVGDGVGALSVGDEVSGPAQHAYASYVVADAARLMRRPATLDAERAGALPVAAEAAHRALAELDVMVGETVLIHGAAGAVGTLATQFALDRGARVIGTAGGAGLSRVTELGAEAVGHGEGVAERVRDIAPHGVDAVLDTSGAEVLALSAELTGDPARVLTLADPQGAQRHGVRFSSAGPGRDHTAPALEQALALHERGTLSLPLHATYPLDQAAEAHRTGEAGRLTGKLVLTTG
ncbi:NADP-dependent oxidoreductase [Streptomyces iconiensis]|uniref:NADP-dependent oxidoreductase n=1 Tax=Streptomyces iconiensis TaxID=1384038 RepID=A0ABT7A4N2_9ACTN|nr:NADP-dependent oxidoreductase [Streptomyces iconiensis]MDJ1136312.1 NADP-dependent oxidoreductase [Streptomyces iconiensis]